MGTCFPTLKVISLDTMSSKVLQLSTVLLLVSGETFSTDLEPSLNDIEVDRQGASLTYPSANGYYDNYYNNYYKTYQGLYDRQDEALDLGSLSFPMLATAFLAAFLASLVGSSLVTNIQRMLSLEFIAPEPMQIRAIPIASSGQVRALDDSLDAISKMYSKYEDS